MGSCSTASGSFPGRSRRRRAGPPARPTPPSWAPYLLGAAGSIVSGRVLDAIGPRPVLAVGLIGGTGLLMAASFAGSVWLFIPLWALGGAITIAGLFYNVTMPITARLYPHRQTAAMTVLVTTGGFSSVVFLPAHRPADRRAGLALGGADPARARRHACHPCTADGAQAAPGARRRGGFKPRLGHPAGGLQQCARRGSLARGVADAGGGGRVVVRSGGAAQSLRAGRDGGGTLDHGGRVSDGSARLPFRFRGVR